MDRDLIIRQLDFLFHVYCAMLYLIKVLVAVLVSGEDEPRVLIFVYCAFQLAFHGLALRQM